jgi:hypothetical protein
MKKGISRRASIERRSAERRANSFQEESQCLPRTPGAVAARGDEWQRLFCALTAVGRGSI